MHGQHNHSRQNGWLRLGIRGKVAAILFATLLISLTINSLLILHAQEQDILEESERRGRDTAQFIARYLAYSVVSYDYHTLELFLQDLTRRHDISYARVENTRGNVMATAGTAPAGSDLPQAYTAEIRLNGELLGKLTLIQSTARVAETMAMRQRELLFGQILAILVVLVVGFAALSLIIIRPLTVITRTIRQNTRSGNARLERIPFDADDEFGELARGFNALGDRLDEARGKLESRITAADQELREAYERLERQAEELRQANRVLEQQNLTDPLTGLYNRRYFEILMNNEVEKAIRSDGTISILLIHIDDFQSAIERLGHRGSDDVVRSVARTIAERTRPTDVVCRYGGSEFVMLCRRATMANAIAMADDLQRAIAQQPLPLHGQEEHVSVSIGVATIPGVHPVSTAAEFFLCADEALRYSRQHEGGVMHFSMIERQDHSAAV